MNIKPTTSAKKIAYPTLASVAAGAILATGSSCQQQVPQVNVNRQPMVLTESAAPPTAPVEKVPEKKEKLKTQEQLKRPYWHTIRKPWGQQILAGHIRPEPKPWEKRPIKP